MSEPIKTAQDYAAVRDWPGYFRAVLGKPARETLLKAMEAFEREPAPASRRRAIDLGCGEGRDTLELLRRGWDVLAIDESREGLDLLAARVMPGDRDRLRIEMASFRETLVAPGSCDLLNASFCLPFCPPEDFPALWEQITRALRPGGRFAGQFFGERDDWAALPDRTHHTRAQVEALLEGFELEMFQEEERQAPHSTGEMKQWHVFHVVGRKK